MPILAVLTSAAAPLSLAQHEFSLHQLEHAFATYEVGAKDGEAFVPARFRLCPATGCLGTRKVDCGGGREHRLGANVHSLTGLCVDLDHLQPGDLTLLTEVWAGDGIHHYWWETYSHTPEAPRARVFFPFAHELVIGAPHQWSEHAWPKLVEHLGLVDFAQADERCRDPSHLYYTPRKPTQDAIRAAGFSPGQALDWRPIVGELPAARPLPAPAQRPPTAPVDLAKLRELLGGLTDPLVARVLAGKPPTPAPESRAPGEPARYSAWLRVTSLFSMRLDGTEPLDAVLEVLEPAWLAEAAESPDDYTEWDVVAGLMESALDTAPAKKAELNALRERERAARVQANARWSASMRARHQIPAPQGEPAPSEAPPPPEEPDPSWEELVKYRTDAKGNRTLVACPQTFAVIFAEHPEWKGNLRFNLMRGYPEIHGGPLWDGRVRELRDNDDVRATTWLSCEPGIELSLSAKDAHDRLVEAAHGNAYDPLEDYLNGLRWDGVPRIREMLLTYFSAQTEADGESIAEHVRTVSFRWMLSAVARGYARDVGAKVDTVLITESGQGARKSQGLRVLGGDFFTDKPISLKSPDDRRLLSQMWIVEIGELEALNTAAVSAQKAFLSATEEPIRAVFGRHHQIHQRRCVFAGSTNEDAYLSDPTGNRRHWPIAVGEVDVAGLRRDRDQLWAEAVHVYKQASTCPSCLADGAAERCPEHRWWLTRDEEAHAAAQAEARMSPSLLEEKVEAHFSAQPAQKRPASVSLLDVAGWAGESERPTRGLEVRIGHALKRLGFVRKRLRVSGKLVYRYETPARLQAPRPQPQAPPTAQA